MSLSVPVTWSEQHRLHAPETAVWVGVPIPADELPARADLIRAELEEAGASVVDAERHARRRAPRRPRSRARRLSPDGVAGLGRRRAHRRPWTERRRGLHLPDAGLRGRNRATCADFALRSHRRVVLRHDDGRRQGNMGGGACSRGHCAERCRSRARRCGRCLRAAAARQDTTSRVRHSAAPAI